MNVNEKQVGGEHYRCSYQHWDFVVEVLAGRYLEGCFSKYVTRTRKKNGLQDLEKSVHYLEKIISFGDGYKPLGSQLDKIGLVAAFCVANDLNAMEAECVVSIATWTSIEELKALRQRILLHIARTKGQQSV